MGDPEGIILTDEHGRRYLKVTRKEAEEEIKLDSDISKVAEDRPKIRRSRKE